MKRWSSYRRVSIEGLNIEKGINKLTSDNVNIYNLVRESYNKVILTVSDKDIPRLQQEFRTADFQYIGSYGIVSIVMTLLHRIGFIVGLVISIVLYSILNLFTLHIEVVGIENIDRNMIIEAVEGFGIRLGAINSYNKDELEKYILNNVDGVSLVSTQTIGTTIVVNIKEESSSVEENIESYVSPYNMVINDFQVFAGISNMYIGQIVRKGDVLIYPEEYTDSDGVLHLVEPKATLFATIWHTVTEVFYKNEIVYSRTGNSITSYKYCIGDKVVIDKTKENCYQLYDTVSRESLVNSSLLPIRYVETVYYETVEEVIEKDFNNSKEKIIANLKSLVYNNKDDIDDVVDEVVDVVELDDRYIVNYYLECTRQINI